MKDKVLVIGGYGQVGKIVCEQLAETFPGKVMAAGRSAAKARDFAETTGGRVIPLQLDVNNPQAVVDALQETRLAVMCLDHTDTGFVAACIAHQTHYIDISPSYQTLARIAALSGEAAAQNVTLLLGVGLAPGLSNLLVKRLAASSERFASVDIFLMLGVGERHGRDGVEWLLNNINQNFNVVENGVSRSVKSFSDGKATVFPGSLGRRTAYRFDLADQHILPQTLGLATVSTRFCYDLVFVTAEVALLKNLGLFTLLKYPQIHQFFIAVFEFLLDSFARLDIGSDTFAVQVDARGIAKTYHASIMGHNNTQTTALVTALAAEKIYASAQPVGVQYLEQLFEFDAVLERLKPYLEFNFSTQ